MWSSKIFVRKVVTNRRKSGHKQDYHNLLMNLLFHYNFLPQIHKISFWLFFMNLNELPTEHCLIFIIIYLFFVGWVVPVIEGLMVGEVEVVFTDKFYHIITLLVDFVKQSYMLLNSFWNICFLCHYPRVVKRSL